MNLFGVKCSQGQLLCCVLCFLVGYFFRSFFHREGFKLSDDQIMEYTNARTSKLEGKGIDFHDYPELAFNENIMQEYKDSAGGLFECIDNLQYDRENVGDDLDDQLLSEETAKEYCFQALKQNQASTKP